MRIVKSLEENLPKTIGVMSMVIKVYLSIFIIILKKTESDIASTRFPDYCALSLTYDRLFYQVDFCSCQVNRRVIGLQIGYYEWNTAQPKFEMTSTECIRLVATPKFIIDGDDQLLAEYGA